MPADSITLTVIVVGCLLVAAVDIWLWAKYGLEATISRYIRRLNQKQPLVAYMLAFGMGALFGHFFL